MEPNRTSVENAANEYLRIGPEEFLGRYSGGRPPRAHYLRLNDMLFPLKALWAAAHRPPIHTRTFQTYKAHRGLSRLGFNDFVEGSAAEQYEEGERSLRESSTLSRNPRLVAAAKCHYGPICQACDFEFGETYGMLGAGYIECHHIDPLSGRDGRNSPTTITDVTVLCANCHRMIHRRKPALTLSELKAALRRARM